MDQEETSKEYVQTTFFETKTLLVPIMSGSTKSPAEGLKDSECERGVITTQPPIPYVVAVDPYKKQEKTEIKTRLPDGTNYQMVPFYLGTNEEYINHVIVMIRVIEQKDLPNSVERVFVTVSKIEEKVGPIHKKTVQLKSLEQPLKPLMVSKRQLKMQKQVK